VALWYGLAAYSCGGSFGIENPPPYPPPLAGEGREGAVFAPHSLLSLCRETVDRRYLTVAVHRLSMIVAAVFDYVVPAAGKMVDPVRGHS